MKQRFPQIFSVCAALLVLLVAAPLRAQDVAPETPDKAPPAEAATQQEAPTPAPASTVVLEAPTPAPAPVSAAPVPAPPEPQWIHRGEVVVLGNDVLIRANERASKVVAIGGDIEMLGRVDGEVVAIGGDVKIDGPVGQLVAVGGDVEMSGSVHGEAVAVGGDMKIHGPVGKLVAVFGDVTLGPKASVRHEVVAVLGEVDNPHQVAIGGQSVELGGFIPLPKFSGIMDWGRDAFGNVRLLSPHVVWPWYVFGGCTLFYLLLAAVFGRGVNACARVLEESPGSTLVTAILLLPLLPLFTLLLILTGVGVLLLPFLAVALLFAGAFGKTAVLAFLGRSVLRPCGAETVAERAWLTVLIGVVLLALLYCVPVVGLLLWALTAWVGCGMVAAAILQNRRREKARIEAQRQAARAAAVQPSASSAAFVAPEGGATPGAQSMPAGIEAPVTEQTAAGSVPPMLQPPARIPLEAISLPRADFWLRLGAILIDIVLVAVATGVTVVLSFLPFPLVFGAYAYGFWLWKGTTIGGIVFNLKVVRLDGRPIDAATALVRTLVAFLSVCAAGLGFLWCLWDPEGQTWHDKVAGTVVVRMPKSTPLV